MACQGRVAATFAIAFVGFLCIGCQANSHDNPTSEDAEIVIESGLGTQSLPIRTSSELAQDLFDQGLRLCWGFDFKRAVQSFRMAQEEDPMCAMCFWGEAYALGPNLNDPMPVENVPLARDAAQKAVDVSLDLSKDEAAVRAVREDALIDAIYARYWNDGEPTQDVYPHVYAARMKTALHMTTHHEGQKNLHVAVIYADSQMNTIPWDYWEDDKETPRPAAAEAKEALEYVLGHDEMHPGAIHLYIHLTEASHHPEVAERYADLLRGQMPGAPHMVHMPSHVYIHTGRYDDAAEVNFKAAEGPPDHHVYPLHNIDFLVYALRMEGRSKQAVAQSDKLRDMAIPLALSNHKEARFHAERFVVQHLLTLVTFEKWEEILELVEDESNQPPEELHYYNAMNRFAKGMAHVGLASNSGKPDPNTIQLAVDEGSGMLEDRAKALANLNDDPEFYGIMPVVSVIDICKHILDGHIVASNDPSSDLAVKQFTDAVTIEDNLPYDEPPTLYLPTRHYLGHALMRAHRNLEAKEVYENELKELPDNGWALHGLVEACVALDDSCHTEAEARFAEAWKHADVSLGNHINPDRLSTNALIAVVMGSGVVFIAVLLYFKKKSDADPLLLRA